MIFDLVFMQVSPVKFCMPDTTKGWNWHISLCTTINKPYPREIIIRRCKSTTKKLLIINHNSFLWNSTCFLYETRQPHEWGSAGNPQINPAEVVPSSFASFFAYINFSAIDLNWMRKLGNFPFHIFHVTFPFWWMYQILSSRARFFSIRRATPPGGGKKVREHREMPSLGNVQGWTNQML